MLVQANGQLSLLKLANLQPAWKLDLAALEEKWRPRKSLDGTVDDMQQVELGIAKKIVARARSLQRGAAQSALVNGVVTVVILLLVLIATLAVARSMVRPLRRLREGALNIATVQLPERVRHLSEAQDPSASLDVAPIDVMSAAALRALARPAPAGPGRRPS